MSGNPIKERLDAMSLLLLDKASDLAAPLEGQIDIFKAVSAYYLGTTRATRGKLAGDEPKTTSFKDILETVQSVRKGMQ